MNQTVLIAHNLRSAHNVGSLLRTADGLGIYKVFLTGYTPHPVYDGDTRMPHEAIKVARQIHKTALGAEETILWEHQNSVQPIIDQLKNDGYTICALEQSENSIKLKDYEGNHKTALIIGNEVTGIDNNILKIVDTILEIPMAGQKESFNVVQAAAMALYHIQYGH